MNWKNLAIIMASSLLILGCGTVKQVPINNETIVNYKDSTVVSYKDSTIVVEIPKEVYRDYTSLLDTLRLETSLAESYAVVDTTNMILKGEIANKTEASLTKVVYLPSEEHIVYRDSVVTKEVPVEVQVVKTHYPKTYWALLAWFILSLVAVGIKLYLKFKK